LPPAASFGPDPQPFAECFLVPKQASGEMKCLILLATVGDRPEWKDRTYSAGQ